MLTQEKKVAYRYQPRTKKELIDTMSHIMRYCEAISHIGNQPEIVVYSIKEADETQNQDHA